MRKRGNEFQVNTQESFTNRFQEDFLQSNQSVAAPQKICNAVIEIMFVINYFTVLNCRDVVH